MIVDFRRARVVTPYQIFEPVRFVWRQGRVALFRVDESSAERLLLETDSTFTKRHLARDPHRLTLSTGEEWEIWPSYQGGCGCKSNPLTGKSFRDLLADEFIA